MAKKPIYPLLLVALPLGLIILGALSFVFYFQSIEKEKQADVEEREKRREAALLLRKEPDGATIQRYEEQIRKEPLEARADLLANFMGGFNMGYEVAKESPLEESGVQPCVVARLEGQDSTRCLIVAAQYAFDPADASAMLLATAHAVTGGRPDQTLLFVLAPESRSFDALLDRLIADGVRPQLLLSLEISDRPTNFVVEGANPATASSALSAYAESGLSIETVEGETLHGFSAPVLRAGAPAIRVGIRKDPAEDAATNASRLAEFLKWVSGV